MALTRDLLARLSERAADPRRRYATAARDEDAVVLSIEEIAQREERWGRRLLDQSLQSDGREMTSDEVERTMNEWCATQAAMREAMAAQMRSWGQIPPAFMTLREDEHGFSTSREPPGAKPLRRPPDDEDWRVFEEAVGRAIPEELKQLYAISDGGFGPGYEGLNSLKDIQNDLDDFRRRGSDYTGNIDYPAELIPLSNEYVYHHYDLEMGKIMASDDRWEENGLTRDEAIVEAFPSLAAFLDDWLHRS